MHFGVQWTLICLVATGLVFGQLLLGLALPAVPVHDSDIEGPAGQIEGKGEALDLSSFWDGIKNKVNELGDTVSTIVEDIGSSPIWGEVKDKANELGDTVNTIAEEVKDKANEIGINSEKLLNETMLEVQTFITSLQNQITLILDSQALQNLSELESLNPNLNFNNSESTDPNEFFIIFENEFQTRMDSRLDFLQLRPEQGSSTAADLELDSQASEADSEGPSRDQKVEFIEAFVDEVGEVFVKVTKDFSFKGKRTTEGFAFVKPVIKTILIIIADVVNFLDQHPWLESVILGILGVLTEFLLSRIFPIRIIFLLLGFGRAGPIKGNFAALAQRVLFGSSVPKGNWFAFLQKTAMKGMKG